MLSILSSIKPKKAEYTSTEATAESKTVERKYLGVIDVIRKVLGNSQEEMYLLHGNNEGKRSYINGKRVSYGTMY